VKTPFAAIRWRWVLAATQLVLACALYLYAPYQLQSQIKAYKSHHPRETIDWGYLQDYYPAKPLRIAYAINFPARIGSAAVGALGLPALYTSRMYHFYASDGAFFVLVFCLWFWVGKKVERWLGRKDNEPEFRRSWSRIAVDIGGVVLFMTLAVAAIRATVQAEPPVSGRGVAIAAVVWYLILTFVLARNLKLQVGGGS
jgi:hypothetical protein